MKRIMMYVAIVLILVVTGSCEKEKRIPVNGSKGKTVDIYLHPMYQTTVGDTGEEPTMFLPTDSIIIPYSEILGYSSEECVFYVSDKISAILNDPENYLYQAPFSVAVDGEMIYRGFFWTRLSSATCRWPVICIEDASGRLQVEVGYPSAPERAPDRRNDPAILEVFRRDGKLVD
ncbi:hypothetical protein [Marinilabilia sp.]|uniref:hypothetical protein n=1 Tax=Marinilabilia sp. TaxID=2021252 RepID=UPI0025B84008|nr:hypothetical protein [Marinilabilia sp.]